MLGRTVAEVMRELGASYPLEGLRDAFAWGHVRVVNLECCFTREGRPWARTDRAFHFGVEPSLGVASLQSIGVTVASLANNHILDFDEEGLRTTLDALDDARIAHAGSGLDALGAFRAAKVSVADSVIAVVALTDHPPEYAAGEGAPGTAFVEVGTKGGGGLDRVVTAVKQALADGACFVIVSAHVGPNFDDEPSGEMRHIAHRLVDAGADLFFGHSAHAVLGVEVYRGRPIVYGAGDLVDDYMVSPTKRNDLGFVYQLQWGPADAFRLECLPTRIADCRARLAAGADADFVLQRFRRLSSRLGTWVAIERGHAVVQSSGQPRVPSVPDSASFPRR